MISKIVAVLLLVEIYNSAFAQRSPKKINLPSDKDNWNAILRAVVVQDNKNSLGRSAGQSLDNSIFAKILRANALARSKATSRTGDDADFLFQGDIDMEKRQVEGVISGGNRRKRAVMRKVSSRLWKPNIHYVISSSLQTRARKAIGQAIKEWEATLPCMGSWKLIRYGTANKPRDYIRFIKGRGCYSKVGRTGGRQSISIGRGCEHAGVVIHEIGHAMGFWHEQSRTDRDNFVNIHWNNIIPGMKFNFEKYSTSKINDLGVGYDYKSVMHYGPRAFSKDGRSTTISPRVRGARIGQRSRLSEKDKEQARLLYNCKDKTTTSTCKDIKTSCPQWGKKGYCNDDRYRYYMNNKCCATCQSINGKPSPCSKSPCLNGGKCSDQGTKFSCKCSSGYSGERCEVKLSPCHSSPCQNGGSCTNQGNTFTCRCPSGFFGKRCEQRRTGCVDRDPLCTTWRSYCRKGSAYYDFMQRECCKTCREFNSGACADKNSNCPSWARVGYCFVARYRVFMKTNCRKSCKVC